MWSTHLNPLPIGPTPIILDFSSFSPYNIHMNKIKNKGNNMKINNYNAIYKIPNNKGGYYNDNTIIDLIKSFGWNVTKVQGSGAGWWITKGANARVGLTPYTGVAKHYYKLMINARDFGIDSPSLYNSFRFATQIRKLLAIGTALKVDDTKKHIGRALHQHNDHNYYVK